MSESAVGVKGAEKGLLEISLKNISQLFNSMDPSPFYDRDLDLHAEQFLVSWAQELPTDTPLRLRLHLNELPPGDKPSEWITQGIHHYFAERARLTRVEFHHLLRQGRTSLAIGVSFLLSCLMLSELLASSDVGIFLGLFRESLNIVGWVAMWRPLQIYLYDWWPLRQQEALYHRLSVIPVSLQQTMQISHGVTL